jgi:O-antigen ligase
MLGQETSRPPFLSAGSLVTVTPKPPAAALPASAGDVRDAEFDLIGRSDLAWDPLLIAVAGYILMAVGRVHQLFPVLDVVRPATVTGLVAITYYAATRESERRFRDVLNGPTKYVGAFLVWMILSLCGALVVSTSFDVVFGNFLKTAVMFVIVAAAIRGPRDVERLAMVYLVSATLYSAVVIARFDLGSGEAWRLGHLYYYDANDFATFAVTALPFGLYFLHAARRTSTRLFAALSLCILAVAFVRTGSRGGFIALVALTAFIVLRYTAIALRWRIAATAIIALVVVATASDQYWTQMGTILSDADYNRTDESGRIQIWQRGIGYMFRNPVFGVGPGNFQAAEGMLSSFAARQQLGVGVRWNAAHNSYIQVGAELGIPGLLIFIAIIASTFGALRRANLSYASEDEDRGDSPRALTNALTASLVAFVVGAYFLSLVYTELFYTLVAMSVGLCKVARQVWPQSD